MKIILAVDDSVVQLTFVQRFAKELVPDHKVVIAKSGEEALELVKTMSNDIALALIDLNMEGMGGMELLKQLKNHIPPHKICVCTANTQKIIESQVLAEGANFIPKPFDKQKFAAAVTHIIRGE